MYNNNQTINHHERICFRRFGRKGYSLFAVLGKEVIISVLSVATLSHASAESISVKTLPSPTDDNDEELTLVDDSAALRDVALPGMEIVGTRIPMPAEKAVRLVQVISRDDIARSAAHTVNDLLKLVAGVDVRQRGAFGVQTDIGVNGGTQDQVTVLLNGVNITSAHTGHLTMDLPVGVDDIERIEVLEGGASRVYGASAFSGAINIVTRNAKGGMAKVEGGSYGTVGGGAAFGFSTSGISHNISGNYGRSDGGTDNSDFNKSQGFYRGSYDNGRLALAWQGGISAMQYGANTFYSAKYNNQYEENDRLMASLTATYRAPVTITANVNWNESKDHYVLNRRNPATYENFHKADTYGVSLNAWTQWMLGRTSLGVEMRRENILSSSLGKPLGEDNWIQVPGRAAYYKNRDGRTNWNVFAEHVILLDRWSISLGVLANKNTALDYPLHLYPGMDVSWKATDDMRLYASFNQSLRMPTYTDLYYTGPNLEGNPNLKPERSTDVSIGMKWAHGPWQAQGRGFYRRGTDMIDWVKFAANDANHAANLDLDYYGMDLLAAYHAPKYGAEGIGQFVRRASVAYSYVYQTKQNIPDGIYSSSYALDYLRHKLVASLTHSIVSRLEAQWDFTLRSRNGEFDLYSFETSSFTQQKYGTHATLDLRLQWTAPSYTLYVQANNLTSHRYYDISNVLQPGFWFMGGVKVMF